MLSACYGLLILQTFPVLLVLVYFLPSLLTMEPHDLVIDQLTEELDKWKGLVPKLELVADEEQAKTTSQTTLVGKIMSDKVIRLGVVRLVL